MYKIKTFNKIDPEGLKRLPEDFTITEDSDCDGIILRSYKMTGEELTDSLCAIARAGAGVNNIPVDKCSEKGIVVFNTPGANANAVKELVILGMLLSARKVAEGMNWVQEQKDASLDVEKEIESHKSTYAGPELLGKKVGLIGLGAIGSLVANTLIAMGMQVYGYDPFISVETAWSMNSQVERVKSIEWMFQNCDFVSLHVPLNESTKGFVNDELIAKAKEGIRIINFARGGLVNDDAILKGVESGTIGCYVTDFPNERLLGVENIIAIPHLGASTPESETNCAIMAADEITDFLKNGNIRNSVNYPACDMGVLSVTERLTIQHRNIPNMVGQITTTLATDNINIDNMLNKNRGDFAYTMLDVDSCVNEKVLNDLEKIEGVLRVRKITK